MEAASKVEVDLTELPAVFDVEEALESDAPVLKEWGTNYFEYEGHECRRVRYGDVETGFEKADEGSGSGHITAGCLENEIVDLAADSSR